MSTPEFVLALREKIGQELLWMPGVTAFVLDPARTRLLAVRRRDNGAWTPVTGIIDPGEQPASAAAREVLEEAGVTCRVLRLVEVRRSEEHTSELQSRGHLVCRLLLEKKKKRKKYINNGGH